MKNILKLLLIAVFGVLAACGKSGKDVPADDLVAENTNQVLYNEAMDIHDEVMPKMGNLMSLKRKLKDTLDTPGLTEAQQNDFKSRVQLLDSAQKSMMDWMHGVYPPEDSTAGEDYRQYIEGKLEDAKKMRSLILEALEKGKL
jgi:predicted small lipoprotein YifL